MADRDDILDVELRIVGQESLGPLAQLVDQLGKITQYQAGLSGLSPEGRVAAARGMVGNRNSPTQSGSAGTHSEPPRIPAQSVESEGGAKGYFARRALDYAREEQAQAYERGGQGITPRSTSFHRRNPVEDMFGQPGGSSGSGSVPPGYKSITDQVLQSDPLAYQIAKEPFVYPQIGNMTAQDRLMFLGGLTQKRAERAQEKRIANDEVAAQAALDAAGGDVKKLQMPDQTADQLGKWDTVTANLRRFGGYAGAAQGVVKDAKWMMSRISGSQNAGIQAGYNKASSINIGPFGITNPFELLGHGSAGKESMRQWWTKQRLRMKGGINGEQASEIQNSLAALGWTGDQGQGIALDTISPLVQQGLNPTMTSMMYDKSMRHGNSTVQDFNKTMDKLGESAAASKMSLEEFQKGLEAAGDAAKQNGGFFRQGTQSSRDFSDATGLGPQALSQTWGSPLVQGMAMSKFGTMPNAMGTMTGNMGVRNTYAALDVAKQATSMFATRDTVDPTTGEVVSGKQAQYAQMAPLMNMSADEVARLDKQRGVNEAASRGLGRLNTYSDMYHGKGMKEQRDKAIKEEMDKDPRVTEGEARRRWESRMRSERGDIGWDSVKRSMYQTAGESDGLKTVEKKEIEKISRMSGEDRIEAAERFLREQNKFAEAENPNTIKIKFTGPAEKLLMEDKSNPWQQAKDDSDAGKKPANGHTSSPQGSQTNSEAQGWVEHLRAGRGADSIPNSSIPPGAAPAGSKGSYGG